MGCCCLMVFEVECVEVIENGEKSLEERVSAYEMLIELVAQIDNANNVAKMGLWPRLMPLLDSHEYELQIHTAWMMAACAQNNPEAAEYLYAQDVIPRLLSFLDGDTNESGLFSKKIVSALSALFQCTEGGFGQFVDAKGLEVFKRVCTRSTQDNESLRARIVFSLHFYVTLCEEYPRCLRENPFFYPLIKEEEIQRQQAENKQ